MELLSLHILEIIYAFNDYIHIVKVFGIGHLDQSGFDLIVTSRKNAKVLIVMLNDNFVNNSH